jgi:hypothetical protein
MSEVSIEFSEEIRSRRVVSRSNHRVTGKYPGLKSQRMHYWESSIELDAFILLDYDKDVVGFSEQPALIRYGQDQSQKHYPDLLVSYGTNKIFVEVKDDDDALSDEVVDRTETITPALAKQGYGYSVWKSSEIRSNRILLENLRVLLRFGRTAISKTCATNVLKWVEAQSPTYWRDVPASSQQDCSLASVSRLILKTYLSISMTEPIHPGTIISIGEC